MADYWDDSNISIGANDWYNDWYSGMEGNAFGGGGGSFNFPSLPNIPQDYSYQMPSIDPALYSGAFTGQGINASIPSGSFGYSNPVSQVGNPYAANQEYGTGGWGSQNLLPSILGTLGAFAPLIGTIAGGGKTRAQTPIMSNTQKSGIQSAAQAQSDLAHGRSPLQRQQGGLLDAIASGRGLDQGYAAAVEQAFQPQMGSLYKQAADAGARRGFYDSPATSPVGGAILGPGLADLQGQIAAQKLAMMMGLPGLYNAPVGQQITAQQGVGSMFSNYPRGTQESMPLGPQIGMGIGGALTGLGGAFAANQQAQNQNQFQNQWLQYMRQQQPMQDQAAQSQNLFGNYQIPDYQLQTRWPETY